MSNIFSFGNKVEAKKHILSKLSKENLSQDFLLNDRGRQTAIYFNEEQARIANAFTSFGFFESEDKARETLVMTLRNNIDVISEWLLTDSPEIKISSTFNEPIGFVFDENEKPIATNTVLSFLRKGKSDLQTFGFYVSVYSPEHPDKI